MSCFEFLRILEKNRKKGIPENLGKHKPLRRSEGHPRRSVALRCSVGYLTSARLKGQKGPPSAMLRLSLATPRRRHCSLKENFWILFRKSRIRTPIV